MLDRRCTTCHYFQIPYPLRYCGHPQNHRELRTNELHRACKLYISMFEKTVITEKIDIYKTLERINAGES